MTRSTVPPTLRKLRREADQTLRAALRHRPGDGSLPAVLARNEAARAESRYEVALMLWVAANGGPPKDDSLPNPRGGPRRRL